jgi:hypothetical protein
MFEAFVPYGVPYRRAAVPALQGKREERELWARNTWLEHFEYCHAI